MASVRTWIQAFRLRTLPLALSGIGMGNIIAFSKHTFSWLTFVLTFLTTLFLQILSNLANDYGDTQNGADHEGRKGPKRAVQSGAISLTQMKKAIYICCFLTLTSGLSLLFVSLNFSFAFLLMFIIGLAAIAAAIKYTMGKNPYGYSGLGDLFVLIFFGFVSVVGSYYLQSNKFDIILCLPSLTCGLFAVAVLNVNNIRDIESDTIAGKISIPVRLGLKKAKIYHYFLLIIGIISTTVFTFNTTTGTYRFLFLMTLPLFAKHMNAIHKGETVEDFDPLLKQMALLSLQFVILYGVGILFKV